MPLATDGSTALWVAPWFGGVRHCPHGRAAGQLVSVSQCLGTCVEGATASQDLQEVSGAALLHLLPSPSLALAWLFSLIFSCLVRLNCCLCLPPGAGWTLLAQPGVTPSVCPWQVQGMRNRLGRILLLSLQSLGWLVLNSQNHGWDHLIPSPCFGQGHFPPDQVAPNLIQVVYSCRSSEFREAFYKKEKEKKKARFFFSLSLLARNANQ